MQKMMDIGAVVDKMDGKVWISGGRVFVENEKEGGMPPLINPSEKIMLIVNGRKCSYLTIVHEEDEIKLIPKNGDLGTEMSVEVSDDGLTAYLAFKPPGKIKRVIKDMSPANRLDLESDETFMRDRPVSVERILEKIKKQGIVYGVLQDVVAEISMANKPGRYRVAEGKAPEQQTDDWIEYFFDEENEKEIDLSENHQGSVDFKNAISYKTVRPGEVIAKLHAGNPGINGITVTGEEIAAREPVKLNIADNGAVFIEKQTGLIRSTKYGRPAKTVVGTNVTFHIYDRLTLDEVGIITGNIRFKGDLEIKGNVHESMEVAAGQNIYVRGNVSFACIYAGNNMTIKGSVISSRLFTGPNDIITMDPAPQIKRIVEGIESLLVNIKHLGKSEISHYQINSLSDAIHYLLNTKNKSFPLTVYDVINQLRTGNYDIEREELVRLIKCSRIFFGDHCDISDTGHLKDYVEILKLSCAKKDDLKTIGNVTISYIQNSEVSAIGSVTVTGKGCYNSQVSAGGGIFISGNVRAGKISSGKCIEAHMVGTELGVRTFLEVPENGWIKMNCVCPDTIIKIGNTPYKFLKEHKLVYAKLVNGKINF